MNYNKLTKAQLIEKLEALQEEFDEYKDDSISIDDLYREYIHNDDVNFEDLELLDDIRDAKSKMEFSDFEKERFYKLIDEL